MPLSMYSQSSLFGKNQQILLKTIQQSVYTQIGPRTSIIIYCLLKYIWQWLKCSSGCFHTRQFACKQAAADVQQARRIFSPCLGSFLSSAAKDAKNVGMAQHSYINIYFLFGTSFRSPNYYFQVFCFLHHILSKFIRIRISINDSLNTGID